MMFSSLTQSQKYLLYHALSHAVEANTGSGFHNGHQGHPIYEAGANGRQSPSDADSPDKSDLYKMMRELAESQKNTENFSREKLVLSWQDFCKMAVTAWDKTQTARE